MNGQLALPVVLVATSPGRPPCPGDKDGVHLYRAKSDACERCGLPFALEAR